MPIRFNNIADIAERTTNVPSYDSDYSFCAWVYVTTHPGDGVTGNILTLQDSVDDADELCIDGQAGTDITVAVFTLASGTPSITSDTSAFTTGTWQHVAIVRSANNSRALYLNGALRQTHTTSVSGRTAPNQLSLGSVPGIDFLNGRIHAARLWTAALTLAEIQNEMYSPEAARKENLYADWPMYPGATERLADWSGNGYALTAGGTLADEDAPPLVFDVPLVFVPAVGGTAYYQIATGGITPAGTLVRRPATAKAGTVTSSGATLKHDATAKTGTLTQSGVIVKQAATVKSGGLTITGALFGRASKLLSGIVASTGTLARQTQNSLSGGVVSSGTVLKQVARSLASAITASGTLASVKAFLVALTGDLASSGDLARQIATARDGAMASAGELVKQTRRAFTGTVTPAGALGAIKTILVALTGILGSAGSLARQTQKTLSGALNAIGALIAGLAGVSRPGCLALSHATVTVISMSCAAANTLTATASARTTMTLTVEECS